MTNDWASILLLLIEGEPLRAEAEARAAKGETPPRDALLLVANSTFHPNEIVRRKDLRKFTGLGDTATDELIKTGELVPFTLHSRGIATGVVASSLLAWQLRGILRRAFGMEAGKADLDNKASHMRARKDARRAAAS
jgi:hypothetical protein